VTFSVVSSGTTHTWVKILFEIIYLCLIELYLLIEESQKCQPAFPITRSRQTSAYIIVFDPRSDQTTDGKVTAVLTIHVACNVRTDLLKLDCIF
jgi:hypothetical protein